VLAAEVWLQDAIACQEKAIVLPVGLPALVANSACAFEVMSSYANHVLDCAIAIKAWCSPAGRLLIFSYPVVSWAIAVKSC